MSWWPNVLKKPEQMVVKCVDQDNSGFYWRYCVIIFLQMLNEILLLVNYYGQSNLAQCNLGTTLMVKLMCC
jgi:hypothetical protein